MIDTTTVALVLTILASYIALYAEIAKLKYRLARIEESLVWIEKYLYAGGKK